MKLSVPFVAAAICASLVACSDAQSAQRPAGTGPPMGSHAPSATAESPDAVGPAGGSFCAGVRKLGLEQKISLTDGSRRVDRSLLPKLDALAAKAPVEISADFALFVKIEHAILGGGAANATVLAQIDSPSTESRLEHVGTYLDDHCGTG